MSCDRLYDEYKTKMQKIADLKYASAVLQWDQETYIPKKGNEYRARQIATLSEVTHRYFTEENFGSLLNELAATEGLNSKEKRNILLTLEDYNKSKKLTADFVRQMSETIHKGFHAWIGFRLDLALLVVLLIVLFVVLFGRLCRTSGRNADEQRGDEQAAEQGRPSSLKTAARSSQGHRRSPLTCRLSRDGSGNAVMRLTGLSHR